MMLAKATQGLVLIDHTIALTPDKAAELADELPDAITAARMQESIRQQPRLFSSDAGGTV